MADGTTRWRRRKEARPAEIEAAALQCFAERGFAASSLDEIAARAGVTKGTLYLYFRSKEDLFKAVVRGALVTRIIAVTETLSTTETAREQLERLFTAWPTILTIPHVSAIPKLIISEAGNFPELTRFYLDEVIARGRAAVIAILRRGIRRGEFRKMDPDVAFYALIAPVLMAIVWKHTFERHDGKPLDVEALAAAHRSIVFDGLLSERTKP
ncbi:MAG TPA: TetR/AcrR family transcriptional regulator [Stellaceae bacterium]|nr:TetR/AcrR family transcriptional regulator [Stellaceae bacterium]